MFNFFEKKPIKEKPIVPKSELDPIKMAFSLTQENEAEIRKTAEASGQDPDAAVATAKANLESMKRAAISRQVKSSGKEAIKEFEKDSIENQERKEQSPDAKLERRPGLGA